jgi:hypothetical protein
MLKATEFEILRGLQSNSRITIPLERKPVRVATLLNEAAFAEQHVMEHLKTVFFEDRVHDWDWSEGKFRFYSRIAGPADVLVVFAYSVE